MLQPQREEGLYAQVRQDERLREQHVARLLETDGYGHLSADGASDMVEQMLRLCTLMYEMLQSGQSQKQGTAVEYPISGTIEQKAVKKAEKHGNIR
ncbi:hypothetical protein [Pontibacter rugosus]|uniref:Uncharacterized protein n=1 Tax=Pontibacter rugosus TaxID=1745966 RepID=A0ABW3SV63_9BACT